MQSTIEVRVLGKIDTSSTVSEVLVLDRKRGPQMSVFRDLKIRGRECQDGNDSGRGKLSWVPLCRQKQNAIASEQ